MRPKVRPARALSCLHVQAVRLSFRSLTLMKYLPVLLSALVLGGCTTLSQNECLTADWESIGYIDGSKGYRSGRIADHTEACAKVGITPDEKLYEEGRGRGLEIFCTARNGLRFGEQGSSYAGVCPVDLEPAFLHGYDVGRNLHDLKEHMSQLQSEVQRTQAQLRSKDAPLNDYERNQLIYRLRDLEREYGRAEADYRRMERQAQHL